MSKNYIHDGVRNRKYVKDERIFVISVFKTPMSKIHSWEKYYKQEILAKQDSCYRGYKIHQKMKESSWFPTPG